MIIEQRVLTIRERIITLKDVQYLANIVYGEYESVADDTRRDLVLSGTCTDGSSFSGADIAVFSDDSPLSRKRVNLITMDFHHYTTKARIEINLSHGNSDWHNYVKVSGVDSKWVNGTIRLIEEALDSFTPQNRFLYRNDLALKSLFALGIGTLFVVLIQLMSPVTSSSNNPKWIIHLNHVLKEFPFLIYVINYAIAYLVGFSPARLLYDKLLELWPSVELQIGPEYRLTEKQRRRWFATALIVGVAPLLTSLVYELLKAFL